MHNTARRESTPIPPIYRQFRRTREDLPGCYYGVDLDHARIGDQMRFRTGDGAWSGWAEVADREVLEEWFGERRVEVWSWLSEIVADVGIFWATVSALTRRLEEAGSITRSNLGR